MNQISLFRDLDEMMPWNDRLQELEVVDVRDEAPDVKTFTFRSRGKWFRYKPGQFITLELPTTSGPLMRTYTLSSSPSRPLTIALTVKAQADSVGSRWMFENLRPGAFVKAYGPSGDFSLHRHSTAKYLFVSAGSGITPMMSMLRWLYDCAPLTDVGFVNCARRPEEIIFRKELELLATHMPCLSLSFIVEERSSREGWFGHIGRIDGVRLPLLSPDFREREIFCCGPDPFMRVVRQMLEASGYDMRRYRQEAFAAPVEEQVPAPFLATGDFKAPVEVITPIRFALSGVEAECVAGQTVLQTARGSGVRIPAACETGLCGTCRVKKLSGDVEMSHNGGILDDEIADGFILACCSQPLTALDIEA
ncbi:hybrid-cluster NAD(P)-dependent oxidoreductase [Phyllobacterium sophorae]|uniref:Hybrid-cluster NAD(P)-dependent oxidoreductase n=1 Tax=Phyllobacterium sophorae TaxID=1520277 RepID=A0A2P7B2Y0_9HYPH|nr:hybrid-cluster NAD(P)-dependent oxidoreductase [Phyllobacterium sophorae]PSH60812.1 hybrid-cluster NAD(P)-dependent oxidoreductase [Phyllobacterium sophorae]